MAGRILDRRQLRKQNDQAEQTSASLSDLEAAAPPKATTKRKAAAPPKARKPRKPKTPPRMRALWCVYDGGMKEVALFDYNQRAAAEAKLAVLLDKRKGLYFMQIVKQPMPVVEPAEAPSVA